MFLLRQDCSIIISPITITHPSLCIKPTYTIDTALVQERSLVFSRDGIPGTYIHLQRVADRESNETRVDGSLGEHGKDGGEEYDDVADHLETHGQPAVGDAAGVVALLVGVHTPL